MCVIFVDCIKFVISYDFFSFSINMYFYANFEFLYKFAPFFFGGSHKLNNLQAPQNLDLPWVTKDSQRSWRGGWALSSCSLEEFM